MQRLLAMHAPAACRLRSGARLRSGSKPFERTVERVRLMLCIPWPLVEKSRTRGVARHRPRHPVQRLWQAWRARSCSIVTCSYRSRWMRMFRCLASGCLCGRWVLAILPHVQPAAHMCAHEVRQRLALLHACMHMPSVNTTSLRRVSLSLLRMPAPTCSRRVCHAAASWPLSVDD
jgi:hypothetical protein